VSARALALVSRSPSDTYRCQHCGPPAPHDLAANHDIALEEAGLPYDADLADTLRGNIEAALQGRRILPWTAPPLAGTVSCGACAGAACIHRHTPSRARLLPFTVPSPAIGAGILAGDLSPLQAGAFMDEPALAAEAWGAAAADPGAPLPPPAPLDAGALAAAGAAAAERVTGARRGFFRRLVRGPGGAPPPPPARPSYGEAPSRPPTDKEVAAAADAAWAGPRAFMERRAAYPSSAAPPPGAPPAQGRIAYPYLDDDLSSTADGRGEEGGEGGGAAPSAPAFKADLGELPVGGGRAVERKGSLLGGPPRRAGGGQGFREMEGLDEAAGGPGGEEGPPERSEREDDEYDDSEDDLY